MKSSGEKKKQSMKTEFPDLAGQREITCYGEKERKKEREREREKERERRHRSWIFFLVFC